MQKIATRVFICASITFGILGLFVVLTGSFGPNKPDSHVSQVFMRLLIANVFVLLPAFALSVAGKYLGGGHK